MGIETPNLLSRAATFLMGILKKCLTIEKSPNEPNNQISPTSVSEQPVPSMEGVFCHSVPPTEDDPLASTEQALSHSVPPMDADHPLPSMDGVFSHSLVPTEGVFSHSVLCMEGNPLPSMEDRMYSVSG